MSWTAVNRGIVRCELCPRLRTYGAEIAAKKRRSFADWTYWGKPVPNFGDPQAQLLIVGLAPAAHGAHRTGRMFTGDRSGDWLYRAMFRTGFANQETAERRGDGLELTGCAITAVCHCAPPDNKPTREELVNCQPWLTKTFDSLPCRVLLALGQIAWNATVDECRRRDWFEGSRPKFGHGAEVELTAGRRLLCSYHPSQQNTFTGRLTEEMLESVFRRARQLLK